MIMRSLQCHPVLRSDRTGSWLQVNRLSLRNNRLKFKASGENRQLVTSEPVEFEKYSVEFQGFRRITDHLKGIYRIYPNLIKETPEDVNM